MAELRTGCRLASASLGQPFETVIFESCLMGRPRSATRSPNEAKYMVASEEISVSPSPGARCSATLKTFSDRRGIANWDGAALANAAASNVGDWHHSMANSSRR